MLKQRGGPEASSTSDDRPRKKLSFREPEIMSFTHHLKTKSSIMQHHHHQQQQQQQHHSSSSSSSSSSTSHVENHHQHHPQGTSAPAPAPAVVPPPSNSTAQQGPILRQSSYSGSSNSSSSGSTNTLQYPKPPPQLGRPHSIAGIVGLGGFCALGGIPGLSNPGTPTPTHSVTSLDLSGCSGSGVPGVSAMGNPGLLGPVGVPGVLDGPVSCLVPPGSPPASLARTISHERSSCSTPPSAKVITPTTPGKPSPPIKSSPKTPPKSSKGGSGQPAQQVFTFSVEQGLEDTKQQKQQQQPQQQQQQQQQPQQQQQQQQPQQQQQQPQQQQQQPQQQQQQPQQQQQQPQQPPEQPQAQQPQQEQQQNQEQQQQPEKTQKLQRKPLLAEDEEISMSLEDLDLENQAMRIVRTVGQAFEVCHKFSVKDTPPSPEPPEDDDDASDKVSQASLEKPKKELIDADSIQDDLVTLTPSDTINEDAVSDPHLHRPTKLEPLAPPQGTDILGTQLSEGAGETYTSPLSEPLQAGDSLPQPGTPLSIHHELQLMREQLKQQQQQTQAAVSQVHLLRDQLAAETAARLEAQARSHQLLVHKQELLERYQAVVLHVRDLELKLQAAGIISSSSPNATSLLPSSHELKTQLSVSISNPHPSPGGLSPCQSAVALDSEGAALTALHTINLPPPTPSPGLANKTFQFPVPTQSPYASSSCLMVAGPQYLHVGAPDTHIAPPPTSREPSPMAGPLIQPLPLATGGGPMSETGEITLAVPQQDNNHLFGAPRLNPPPQRRVTRCEDGSTPSVSSEGDTKRDSGQSSGESVTHAIAQLYNLDNSSGRWLTQVPEDAVSMGPYGPTPLGASRLMNGPITRTASERVSRQETLAQLQRMAWARHTTK